MKLDEHEREVLGGFAQAFEGATIELVSPQAAEKRRQDSQGFNDFCEQITADVLSMKNNAGLLRQHRSERTLAQLDTYRRRDRRRFLQLLFPHQDGYIDLRAVKRGADEKEKIRTAMVPAGDLRAVESFVTRYARERDVYIGVASRLDPKRSGTLQNCGRVSAVFTDIDFRDTPESEAKERLAAFSQQPDMIVHSGGGFHAYWLLDTPCDLQESASLFKRHLRAIAKAVGGDIRCAEPAHILRVPGTFNHKYFPIREVTLVQA